MQSYGNDKNHVRCSYLFRTLFGYWVIRLTSGWVKEKCMRKEGRTGKGGGEQEGGRRERGRGKLGEERQVGRHSLLCAEP